MNPDDPPEFLQAYSILCNEGLSPLTTIAGYADLAMQGAFGPLTLEQSQAFTVIAQQTKQAMQTWRQGLDYLRAAYQEVVLEWRPLADLIEHITTHIQPSLPNLIIASTIDARTVIQCDKLLVGSAMAHLIAPMELIRNQTNTRLPGIQFYSSANATIDCEIHSLAMPEITSEHLDYLMQLPGVSLNIARRIINKHGSRLTIQVASDGINMHFTLPSR